MKRRAPGQKMGVLAGGGTTVELGRCGPRLPSVRWLSAWISDSRSATLGVLVEHLEVRSARPDAGGDVDRGLPGPPQDG